MKTLYARLGLTSTLTDTGIGMVSRLAGDGAFLGDLRTTSTTDRHRLELTGGPNMSLSGDVALQVQAQTALSPNAVDYGGFARLKLRF